VDAPWSESDKIGRRTVCFETVNHASGKNCKLSVRAGPALGIKRITIRA